MAKRLRDVSRQRPRELSAEELRTLYRLMVTVRLFNEKATLLQRQGRLHSFLNCIGQEAAIIGSAYALRPDDWIFPTYREHPVPLLRGVELKELFNHLIANSADRAKGRNLPPEYSFRHINFVSISAPVGTQIPQATGFAHAARLSGENLVVLAYCGEGATSEGDFHTGLNFAGVWKAPVVFFVQNNGWAISVPTSLQTASEGFAIKAEAYGIAGEAVDGNDLVAVHEVTTRAVERARSGNGPTLIEAKTYRLGPHSTSDDPRLYRPESEVAEWTGKDPIARLRKTLEGMEAWSEEFGTTTEREAAQEVQQAAAEALKEPMPDVQTMFEDVYDKIPWHLWEQREEYLEFVREKSEE
ncbi:MAG: pyruvate dehydrogenase (acetyl-transferring) E1 component subunit alpha [Acidobacteria bacterium]|nr:MAG: pyruvate dehydrogenase (acetyl-transferring) E1 component subunit alpha [Acidobacteriota bacterium]